MTDQPATRDQTVDLTNCDREPIHILGRIQSFGFLIAVSNDWIIGHASANCEEFTGRAAEDLIGCPATECLSADAIHDIRSRLQVLMANDGVERLFGCALFGDERLFDIAIHLSGSAIVIEAEPAQPEEKQRDLFSSVRPLIDRVKMGETPEQLCEIAAKQIRGVTRFDRVMIYRFDADGSGEVVAESLGNEDESYLGLRFPASDIPKQARAMYARNLLRIISDVDDATVPIIPELNPHGEPLDLTLSVLRAVSPIHIEYLKNMGVRSSMSISIMRHGKLWGLIACHGREPKQIPYGVRTACELFAELFAFVLDQKDNDQAREEQGRASALHDRLMAQLAEGDNLLQSFDLIADSIGNVIPHDGVAGWIDGVFQSRGSTPNEEEFVQLARFLNTTSAGRVWSTDRLSELFPPAADYVDRAAGLLALPVSRTPRDYLVLFRGEVQQTVTWAGNPDKPVEAGPNGVRLTPRKSFDAWRQTVDGQSVRWTESDVQAAESLRVTLVEVILRITDAANRDRQRASEQQELLIAELNHRVRNILNLIRGLVQQSRPTDEQSAVFADIVGSRIQALARAHDQITKTNWNPASLRDLIAAECDAYLDRKATRVAIEGPDALLKPEAFSTVALVLHELITNSAKYGALSDSRGIVEIDLAEEADGALTMSWRERNGPRVEAPTKRGFGSTIIERSIPYDLKGKAEVSFELTGLKAHFLVPADCVAEFGETENAGPDDASPAEAAEADIAIETVLIVEDNLIIALEAEDIIREIGVGQIHVAASVNDAMNLLDRHDVDWAMLDVNLGQETSLPVAERLREEQVPFIFTTGYGEQEFQRGAFEDIAVVQKPYRTEAVRAEILRAPGPDGTQ